MIVAVLGLGEAGGRIAADLEGAGVTVQGFDPARGGGSAVEAVAGAEFVLSINAASVALEVARGVASSLDPGAVYADLNTGSPELKRELAAAVPVAFADVALVGVVPATGLKTAALASGDGAERFAEAFRPLGMPVTVVEDAAGLKLLRSVFMKGMAAAAIEAVEAGRAAGVEQHVRDDIAGAIGESLLERLLTGSKQHAARRTEEMRTSAAYVEQLGVEPRIARAAADWLAELYEPWPWPDSLDALVAAPEHHLLLFENADVRVLETRIAPGGTTPVHTHRWAGPMYVRSFDHFVRRDGNGATLYDSRDGGDLPKPGSASWSPAFPPHSLENAGASAIDVITVELKR
jgi:3-hydroxyisobutyrate dehydrogenase-like beta-hydroxyacid dehydrogenase